MRRNLSIVAAFLLTLALPQGRALAGVPIPEIDLPINDSALEINTTGTGNNDYFIDLTKVSPSFFQNNYAVLDTRITYDLSKVANPSCPPNITLRTSDSTKAGLAYVRRSSANNVAVQRVAIAQPRERQYLLQVRRDGNGVATSGPCVTLTNLSVPYTLKVTLAREAALGVGGGFAYAVQHMPTRGDGEPSIAVDKRNNNVYISAPVGGPAVVGGMPGGVDFWRSLNGGATFTYSQPVFSLNTTGGFDSHIAVDRSGTVYVLDLAATTIFVGRSIDSGGSWTGLVPAGNDADREWIAVYGPTANGTIKAFISYHDINVDNYPWECVSPDGGATWPTVCNPMLTDPEALADGFDNTTIGPQVFDSTGTVYDVISTPKAGDVNLTYRSIWLARSSDGKNFTNKLIHRAPVGYDTGGLFPTIAVDSADNLYAVWSERLAPSGSSVVMLSYSTDHGDHWSPPQTISTTGQSALLPWVTAFAPGMVDVTWTGSTTGSSNDPTANWYQYVAQNRAVLTSSTWTTSRVSSHPIRYGTVCLSGIGCSTAGDDGRILLDFTSIDADSFGNAHLTYANSGPEGYAVDPSMPYTDYAKQTSGRRIVR
jgi:hypothetical protein